MKSYYATTIKALSPLSLKPAVEDWSPRDEDDAAAFQPAACRHSLSANKLEPPGEEDEAGIFPNDRRRTSECEQRLLSLSLLFVLVVLHTQRARKRDSAVSFGGTGRRPQAVLRFLERSKV